MALNISTKKVNQSNKPTQAETQQSLTCQSINFSSKKAKNEVFYSDLNDNVYLTNYSNKKPLNNNCYTSSLTEESTAYLTQSKTKTLTNRKEKQNINLKKKSPESESCILLDNNNK